MKRIEKMKSLLLRLKCRVKISKSVLEVGGILNKIISGALFILASFNLINSIFKDLEPDVMILSTVPIYIISIMFLFLKKKIILSMLLLAIAILSTISKENIGNYSGSIFFILSFCLMPNKYYSILLSVLTIICISINSNINHMAFNTTFNLMIAYFIVYALFYIIIYRFILNLLNKIKELEKQLKEKNTPKPIIRNIDVINIKEEDKAIIKLFCNGMSYENISRFTGINNASDTIRRKITKVKNDNDLESDAKLGKWMFDSV